ncbi:MAG: DapH/DapD/GlmU-related protein [Candidatus Eremiobacterota bacterium]
MNGLIQTIFPLFLYVLGGLVLGISLFPAVLLTSWTYQQAGGLGPTLRLLLTSLALGVGYFLYGFSLMLVTSLLNALFGLRLRPGKHGYFSLESLRWVLASGLHLVVKVTFIDFVVLSPFLNTWFRLLGARIGSGVMINSKFVHDVSLLEIGDGSIIGGEAAISCHAAEKGYLVLSPIKIGKNVLVGQRTILMPGVEIGDGAIVAAQAVVLKDTKIPAGEVWVGIPARKKED